MDQVATVDTARLEVLKFAHGVTEPTFTVDEAQQSRSVRTRVQEEIANIDRSQRRRQGGDHGRHRPISERRREPEWVRRG